MVPFGGMVPLNSMAGVPLSSMMGVPLSSMMGVPINPMGMGMGMGMSMGMGSSTGISPGMGMMGQMGGGGMVGMGGMSSGAPLPRPLVISPGGRDTSLCDHLFARMGDALERWHCAAHLCQRGD